jgi:hypothetical protein
MDSQFPFPNLFILYSLVDELGNKVSDLVTFVAHRTPLARFRLRFAPEAAATCCAHLPLTPSHR